MVIQTYSPPTEPGEITFKGKMSFNGVPDKDGWTKLSGYIDLDPQGPQKFWVQAIYQEITKKGQSITFNVLSGRVMEKRGPKEKVLDTFEIIGCQRNRHDRHIATPLIHVVSQMKRYHCEILLADDIDKLAKTETAFKTAVHGRAWPEK